MTGDQAMTNSRRSLFTQQILGDRTLTPHMQQQTGPGLRHRIPRLRAGGSLLVWFPLKHSHRCQSPRAKASGYWNLGFSAYVSPILWALFQRPGTLEFLRCAARGDYADNLRVVLSSSYRLLQKLQRLQPPDKCMWLPVRPYCLWVWLFAAERLKRPKPRGPRGSTGAGHWWHFVSVSRLRCRRRSNMPASRCSYCFATTHNSCCSQLLHETGPGLVPASLNEGVFCLLIESDCSMGFLCSSADLCLHLGVFADLIDNHVEFFVRYCSISERRRDMICDGVKFTLRENDEVRVFFSPSLTAGGWWIYPRHQGAHSQRLQFRALGRPGQLWSLSRGRHPQCPFPY